MALEIYVPIGTAERPVKRSGQRFVIGGDMPRNVNNVQLPRPARYQRQAPPDPFRAVDPFAPGNHAVEEEMPAGNPGGFPEEAAMPAGFELHGSIKSEKPPKKKRVPICKCCKTSHSKRRQVHHCTACGSEVCNRQINVSTNSRGMAVVQHVVARQDKNGVDLCGPVITYAKHEQTSIQIKGRR